MDQSGLRPILAAKLKSLGCRLGHYEGVMHDVKAAMHPINRVHSSRIVDLLQDQG